MVILAGVSREDFVVAFITSQPQAVSFDNVVIQESDPEFAQTRLVTTSTIRVSRLVTLNSSVFLDRLGRIGPATEARVLSAVRLLFV